MKRAFFLLAALSGYGLSVMACPLCEKQQPKIFRGITHGAGPQSEWDYVIVAAIAVVVAFTTWYSVKFLLRPGEQSGTHIKRLVLNIPEDGL